MRARELFKKYPDIWNAVEAEVLEADWKTTIQIAAHNAAFVACSEHHKCVQKHKQKPLPPTKAKHKYCR